MSFITQSLRLFLIIAMVLPSVQNLFAVQAGMQNDYPMVAASGVVRIGVLKMFTEDCSKHGKSGYSQGPNQCGICPLSLGIVQMTPKRYDVNTQIQHAISDVPLYNSTDLSPDYRPPRYS